MVTKGHQRWCPFLVITPAYLEPIMPLGEAHRRQSAKNWLLFLLLLVLVASVFSISMLRIKHSSSAATPAATNTD